MFVNVHFVRRLIFRFAKCLYTAIAINNAGGRGRDCTPDIVYILFLIKCDNEEETRMRSSAAKNIMYVCLYA